MNLGIPIHHGEHGGHGGRSISVRHITYHLMSVFLNASRALRFRRVAVLAVVQRRLG